MRLAGLAIETGVMRKGMTLRDFFEEAVRCNVPGLPYVDEQGEIDARISIRDVYKHLAVPDYLLRVADTIGDRTDKLDLVELEVTESLKAPVEQFLLKNIVYVSPQSSIVKSLALMEMYNTGYIFLMEEGVYKGVVTRMVIARRMLKLLKDQEERK